MSSIVLTDEQMFDCFDRQCAEIVVNFDADELYPVGRAIEQAVLQSPEVQALRKDAEAFRLMVSCRLTVKVDEVCSDVEVFHLGECLAWPPAHHCENDEEVAAVAREAIQKAVATLKEQS